ncbi:MAG TPA: peptidoglycan editing factor PgeF [Chryseolinea sp.]|nr:peptidoglycan editing factor PgeF [Chryseolinea sp.]
MKIVVRNGLSLWEFDGLSALRGIRHFVTDRNTNPQGEPFTLSFSSTPDRALVVNNRRLLAEAMRVDEQALFLPSQVHKTHIVHVSPSTTKEELTETDALITTHPDVCIAVMSADCVPIILYDAKNKVVAAVHSGWRGTVARILEKTLNEMHDRYGTIGADVFAGIGPSVSQESYEVGLEVITAVQASFDAHGELLVHTLPQKAKLDLWNANRQQLLEFDVPDGHIEVSNLCTVIHNHAFFSARKGDAGRFAAGIMITDG